MRIIRCFTRWCMCYENCTFWTIIIFCWPILDFLVVIWTLSSLFWYYWCKVLSVRIYVAGYGDGDVDDVLLNSFQSLTLPLTLNHSVKGRPILSLTGVGIIALITEWCSGPALILESLPLKFENPMTTSGPRPYISVLDPLIRPDNEEVRASSEPYLCPGVSPLDRTCKWPDNCQFSGQINRQLDRDILEADFFSWLWRTVHAEEF